MWMRWQFAVTAAKLNTVTNSAEWGIFTSNPLFFHSPSSRSYNNSYPFHLILTYKVPSLGCKGDTIKKKISRDSLGGAVVRNPPANAGDMDSSPGSGRSHMLRSN